MATQVSGLYKDESGGIRSILSRQFISFSYGGKSIEEFNLIAVFSGDRLSKNVYAPFEDTTTQQEELDGQFYWRSKFGANELQFNLSTDGMTQNELDEFKMWFKPGVEREFILSENNNRAIMARVSTTPTISMLPFEYEEEILIGSKKVKITTTMFKGDIILNFIMDEPYWYSLESYFSGEDIDILKAKIIFEDGIPHLNMFNKSQTNILLADKYVCNKRIISNSTGLNIDGVTQNDAYLYYCGTAQEKPHISFFINIKKDSTSGKVSFPKIEDGSKFYYLKLGTNKLLFTLPSIMLAYNKVIDLFNSNRNIEIIDFKKLIRDEVYDYYVRAYSIYYLTKNENNKNWRDGFKTFMLGFFSKGKITFDIDSKKGIVKISSYVKVDDSEKEIAIEENAGNMIKSPYLTISDRTMPKNGSINDFLQITTNSTINNFIIDYKYKYL